MRRASAPRPLLITADDLLLDDVLRLCAHAGVEPDVATDLVAARSRLAAAKLVLLGGDVAAAPGSRHLASRGDLVIVCRSAGDSRPWDHASTWGARHVVLLPPADSWLIERIGQAAREVPDLGKVVAVMGARGGAGASVLATAVASVAAKSGLRTLLVDADPLGGGADLLLGWEDEHGMRWPELAGGHGQVDAEALMSALPGRDDLVVLSCARDEAGRHDGGPAQAPSLPVDLMAAALDAGQHGRDLVVVDLPRSFAAAAVAALQAADRMLLVVPAELRAVAAGVRVTDVVRAYRDELSVVVRGPVPGKLSAAQIAAALGLPLAGTLRPEPRLNAAVERGDAPGANSRGPLATFSRHLLRELRHE